MSTKSGEFEGFNQRIADAMVASSEQGGGLPQYLGIHLREMTPGRLVATMDVRPELITPMGAVHGGVMAGFVDHCLGCVLYPLMKPGQWAATTEFKLNYLRAVRAGTLTAESTVLSMGRRSAVVRVDVRNDGTLACVAQGTLLVSDPPGAK
ncbi:MAG: PaaI family thioesterase [Deltaproteobacteria bacterium]|nr:PaaI family thioesterase [Deltaproteobacteria bacterium]